GDDERPKEPRTGCCSVTGPRIRVGLDGLHRVGDAPVVRPLEGRGGAVVRVPRAASHQTATLTPFCRATSMSFGMSGGPGAISFAMLVMSCEPLPLAPVPEIIPPPPAPKRKLCTVPAGRCTRVPVSAITVLPP